MGIADREGNEWLVALDADGASVYPPWRSRETVELPGERERASLHVACT
jgi:hypothetical protein